MREGHPAHRSCLEDTPPLSFLRRRARALPASSNMDSDRVDQPSVPPLCASGCGFFAVRRFAGPLSFLPAKARAVSLLHRPWKLLGGRSRNLPATVGGTWDALDPAGNVPRPFRA